MKKLCELLERYLQGDLKKNEIEVFENHLLECEKCKKEVELEKEVEEYLNSIPKVKVPDNFSNIVIEKIYNHKQKVQSWYIYAVVAFVSFVSALFAGTVIGWKNVADSAIYFGESVYNLAVSFLTAVITLSGTLYNALTPGKVNGISLIFVFVVVLVIFLKSVKVFSSVER